MDAAPKDAKGILPERDGFAQSLRHRGQVQALPTGTTELVLGIKALASHGHTPGHTTSYLVENKGEKSRAAGRSSLHVAAVQFPEPAVTIQFDVDSKSAAKERKLAFADAARNGYWVGAAHIAFPGLGHLRAEGNGYVWHPRELTRRCG